MHDRAAMPTAKTKIKGLQSRDHPTGLFFKKVLEKNKSINFGIFENLIFGFFKKNDIFKFWDF